MDYYAALICMNGHKINHRAKVDSADNDTHCGKCGEATITTCSGCGVRIRGEPITANARFGGYRGYNWKQPLYCYGCGKPYPWTEKGHEEAKAILDEAYTLTDDERETLNANFPDLIQDTSNTNRALLFYQKTKDKIPAELLSNFKKIIFNLTEEGLKKNFFD